MTLETINYQGKEYYEVSTRLNYFRRAKQYQGWRLKTKVVSQTEDSVLMKAMILDDKGRVVATGHAIEKKDGSRVNQRNHVENCETSAVGRALGFLGIASDGSIASYEEVVNAVENQKKDSVKPATKPKAEKKKEYILETDNFKKVLLYMAKNKDKMSLSEMIKKFEDEKYGKLTTKEKGKLKEAYEGK